MTKSKQVQAALKAAGYSARQVSVRDGGGSLSTSLDVTIRDPKVSFKRVKEIAEKFENIHYCTVTQEILGGGNTFVSVRFSEQAIAEGVKPLVPAVDEALAKLAVATSPNGLCRIGDTGYMVGRQLNGALGLWGESAFVSQAHDAGQLARNLFVNMSKEKN